VDTSIHYTITLKNTNDSGADTNVSLTDAAPPGYVITGLSAPSSQTSSFTASSITVGYDVLAVHQLRAVTVTATVPETSGVTASNCGKLDGQNLLGSALTQLTSTCADTTPVKIPTVIFINPQHGDYNDADTVTATLKDAFANTLSGKQLTFTLNGLETCSATTDALGVATCNITPSEAAGGYTLTAAYTDSTDPKYSTSSKSATFTVDKEETTTAYTGATVLLGSSATLKGTLLEDGTTPIVGRTLTLGVGGTTCSALTNASGVASCTVSTASLGSSQALTADFAGDAFYLASSDHSKTAVVFAFPSSGAFALGDTTASTAGSSTVTWWSSAWNQVNVLTGGQAPSAFKGFAAAVPLPTSSPATVCSASWTSSGGNSPPPPATVPTFMGVVVADSVTKSGTTVNGHYAKIVVVATNPGYAPGPSNTGTGTIIATFCTAP
jgi:Big-like domain-containing protein